MTDIRPMLEEGAAPLEAELLREARAVLPSEASVQRALSALGVTGAAGTLGSAALAAAAAKSGSSALVVLFAKWVLIGVAGGLLAIGATDRMQGLWARGEVAPPTPTAREVASPAGTLAVQESAVGEPAREAEPPSSRTSAGPSRALPPRSVERSGGATEELPVEPSRAPSTPSGALAREVALLDEAKAALEGGRPAQALAALERHRKEMPAGRLTPEAAYLRVAAMLERGDRQAAENAAERLLASDPTSPHAKRVRALLERARSKRP